MAKNKNHHLENRNGVWYLRQRRKGKLKYKKLSSSVIQARQMRDEILAKGVELNFENIFWGEVVAKWKDHQLKRIDLGQLKNSTWRDWKSSMNRYSIPYFGNLRLCQIGVGDIEEFVNTLNCSPKRVNNILVPLRSVFKYARRHGYCIINPMEDVANLKLDPPDIRPMTMDEVRNVCVATELHYQPFMRIAFLTGMRFGEIAALKWSDVDLLLRVIHIRKTLVYGELGRTKTARSKRSITMVGPVHGILGEMKKKGNYVFYDRKGALMTPDHFREVVWKPALKRAELPYRPPIQTRHTFATMMIDVGEDIGWVQRMLGHGSLQMIYTRYYAWIEAKNSLAGRAFSAEYNKCTTGN